MKKRVKITKEGMQEFNAFEKQCWISILSFLSFEELLEYKIASVCKTFLFILSENDRFWALFVQKNHHITQLPKQYPTWKKFYLSQLRMGWNKERASQFFRIDDKDPTKLITGGYEDKGWECIITRNALMENYLYPFQINYKQIEVSAYFPIGVCAEETKLDSRCSFGSDESRFGYYFAGNTGYLCNNGRGKHLPSLKTFKNNCKVLILVHEGSQSQGKGTVSFFYQQENSEKIEYQVTLLEVPLSKNGRLYGYFAGYTNEVTVKMLPPFLFEEKYMENVSKLEVAK